MARKMGTLLKNVDAQEACETSRADCQQSDAASLLVSAKP
jgi:hypothetical protein